MFITTLLTPLETVLLLLLIPLITGFIIGLVKSVKLGEIATIIASILLLILSIDVLMYVAYIGNIECLYSEFRIDALSSWILLAITLIVTISAMYSVGYIRHGIMKKYITTERAAVYYMLLNFFEFTMILVVLTNNIIMLWIAIEATTLASAHLIAVYRTPETIEAAWKYIILCSTGIAFGLYGIITIYYTAYQAGIPNPLLWTSLVMYAHVLGQYKLFMRVALVLVIIGFGTKAGLAPLHTWVPDAYSEAPSPVSAILSAILEGCAIYAIMRFYVISILAGVGEFTRFALILVGILSMMISALHMIVVKDVKRMFALSSVEHMGLIACALGFGGSIGTLAAVFHVMNHALVKAALFLLAGNIFVMFGTREIEKIKGMFKIHPLNGALLVAGVYAIIGGPPFNIFQSELLAIVAGVNSGMIIALILFLVFLIVAFGALLVHCINMASGELEHNSRVGSYSRIWCIPILILLILSLLFGIYLPDPLRKCLEAASKIVAGEAL